MRGIAAFPDRRKPEFAEIPEPSPPGPTEVLCRTLKLGICGTDREILQSAKPWKPPAAEFLILGHECLARVESVGEEVARLRPGDLVVPTVRRGPVGAEHRIDMQSFGNYTERGIVQLHGFSVPLWVDDERYLYRIDSPELAEVAVFTEPLAVAEKGVNEALALQRARLGEEAWTEPPPRVLVTGLGPIAFAGVLACLARGWEVTLYGRDEPDTFRAALGQQLGAHYLSAAEANFAPSDVEETGYDFILECTGSDALTVRVSGLLASRGVMVWLGAARVPQPADHNVARMMRDAVVRNHLHVGCVNAAPRDFRYALDHLEYFLQSQPENLRQLLTAHLSPEESLWHYHNREPQGIKTVLVYD